MFGAVMTTTSTAGSSITARQSALAAAKPNEPSASSRRARDGVGAVREHRVERAVLEVRADALHRARVGVPEPAEADDADADLAAGPRRAGAPGLRGGTHATRSSTGARVSMNSMLRLTAAIGPLPTTGSGPVIAVSCSSTHQRE